MRIEATRTEEKRITFLFSSSPLSLIFLFLSIFPFLPSFLLPHFVHSPSAFHLSIFLSFFLPVYENSSTTKNRIMNPFITLLKVLCDIDIGKVVDRNHKVLKRIRMRRLDICSKKQKGKKKKNTQRCELLLFFLYY